MKKMLNRWFSKNDLFAGGTGTREDPYLIENAGHLIAVKNNLEAHFRLLADIDLSGSKWSPLGNNEERFSGSFDGNGFRILNLTIRSPESDCIGLFGCINSQAGITSLALEGCCIKGKNFVGALAAVNIGHISQCCIKGEIAGRSHVGGLNGWNVEKGAIKDCYSLADIQGEDSVGGLVGANFDSVNCCYVAGKVRGKRHYIGGIVGLDYLNYRGDVKDCYYDLEITGQSDTGKGIPKLDKEMKQKDTFENWDFNKIWDIENGKTYPLLKVFAKVSESSPLKE